MFKIVPLEARHKLAVLDLLFESFLPENPLTIALELKKEDVAQAFEQMVEDSLKDGFSFVALDENGVLIGCRLSELWKHDVSKPKRSSSELQKSADKIRIIEDFLDRLEKDFNAAYPDVEKVLKFSVLTVHPKFRRYGIARQLVQKSIDVAKLTGIPMIRAQNVTYKTQNLCESLGFKTLGTYEYANTPFQNVPKDEKCAKQMVLELFDFLK